MRFSDEVADHLLKQALEHARYARKLVQAAGTGHGTHLYPPAHMIAARAWIRGDINEGELLSKVKPKKSA